MKNLKHFFLLFLCVFLHINSVTSQTTIYVTLSGNGAKDGSSWSNAMGGNGASGNQYLYQIIDNASENTVIMVGSASPAGVEVSFSLPNTSASYKLKKGVQVLGGYYDVDGSPQRNIINSNTVFDVATSGNSRTQSVIVSDGGDITGGLYEGFIIRNAGSSGSRASYGGGVLISGVSTAGANPVLNQLQIKNCYAGYGGGVAFRNNTVPVTASNITVSNSTAATSGGGIYITGFSPILSNISLAENRAGYGGGLYITDASSDSNAAYTISRLTANGNTATGSGGGIYINKLDNAKLKFIKTLSNSASTNGGGMYITDFTGTMDSVQANNNNATSGAGGGIYARTIKGTMNKVEASSNTTKSPAGRGGGIYLETYEGTYSNFTVNNNTGASIGDEYYGGGGMYIKMTAADGVNINVNNLHIEGNEVVGPYGHGGGLYIFGDDGTRRNMQITLDNVTVKNNKLGSEGYGGGIYLLHFKKAYNVRADFKNVTVTGNYAGFDGGGVCNWVFYGSYYNLNVSDNTAGRNGGGMYNTTAFIDLPYLTAEYNNAGLHGGGLYNTTATGAEDSPITITKGKVNYNRARGYGGGFNNTTAAIDCRHMEVRGNYAGYGGGGLFNTTVHYQFLWNVLIVENYSGEYGGGIHNTTAHCSGRLENLRYVNTTIAANYSLRGGGGVFNTTATQWYQNSIVAGNYSPASTSQNIYNDVISSYATYKIRADQSLLATVSNQNNILINYSGLSPDNNNINNNADPLFVYPIDASIFGSIEPRDLGYAGDYHLQETSPCIDKGHDGFIRPLSTYPWMDVDLDEYVRIQGAAVDMGAYEGPGEIDITCPPVAIWTPVANGIANDWNNRNNWQPRKVPGTCTTVYIPGNAKTFPYLNASDNAVCDQIVFIQGGEIGRQDLLTYNKAYVQYDFKYANYVTSPEAETALKKATDYANVSTKDHLGFSGDRAKSSVSRSKWHMLSAPIQKVVSGDFAFGGYPRTFMMRFILQNESGYTVGQFTEPFATQNVELKAGEGFAFWMNEYSDKPLYREYEIGNDNEGLNAAYFGVALREYGIQTSNGVLQLPYFQTDTLLMSHRIAKHDANTGVSDFYYYNMESSNLDVIDQKDAYQRTAGASDLTPFRLHDALINFNVGEITGEQEILIGNPFMSTIDFEKFYAANSGTIYGTYRIYNGTSYEVFHLGSDNNPNWTATGAVDKYIAPLQGFFVTLKAGKTSNHLVFDVANISAKRPASSQSVLKNAEETAGKNTIRIKTFNEYADSEAIIGKREGTANQYNPAEDVYKLFSSNGGVPEVYTYADNYPAVMNFIGNTDITIPVGIRTKATMNTTLQLTGMNGYENADVLFVDKEQNKTIDITGEELFEYPFENTTGNVTDRFFIQFIATGTNIENVTPESSINIYTMSDKITVTSPAGDLIKQIGIYDVQGRLVYKAESINDNHVSLDADFPKQTILIVKVLSGKGSKNAKVLLK